MTFSFQQYIWGGGRWGNKGMYWFRTTKTKFSAQGDLFASEVRARNKRQTQEREGEGEGERNRERGQGHFSGRDL